MKLPAGYPAGHVRPVNHMCLTNVVVINSREAIVAAMSCRGPTPAIERVSTCPDELEAAVLSHIPTSPRKGSR